MDKIVRTIKLYGKPEVVITSLRAPCTEAKMATDMIVKWGMVAAEDDGEDTAGRHKIKLSSPKNLVDRAVEMAELACQAFEDKGWFLALPTPGEDKPEGEDISP